MRREYPARPKALGTREGAPGRRDGSEHLVERSWAGMALLRLGAAAVIGIYALTYRALPAHPAPAYVRPAAVALAGVVAALATAQLRWRTSRALALASVVADAGVMAGLLWLYGFDPRRYLFALVIPVQAEATLLLGLVGGGAVWAAMGASYAMQEALAGPLYGIPTDPVAVAVRLSAGLFVVLVTATLFQGVATEHRRFTALLQAAPDAIVVVDASGRIVLANGRAEAIFGYGLGELVGKAVEVLIPNRFREAHEQHRVEYATAPRVRFLGKELQLVALRRDGTEVPVEIGLSFVEEREGLLVTSVIRDVTDQRRAEEALRESERRFRALTENSSDWVACMGPDAEIGYLSTSVERVLGYTVEEVLGRSAFDWMHPDDRDGVAQVLSEVAQTPGSTGSIELRLRHKDESWRWVEAVATNMLHDPAVGAVVVNSRDVTERKQAEVALRQSEAKHRSLVEQLPAIVYLAEFGEEGAWLYVSPQVGSILGYSSEEWMNHPSPMASFVHPEDLERVRAVEAHSQETGDSFGLEYRVRAGDGRWVWILDEAVAVRDETGHPLYLQGVMYDITDRKRAEEELRESYETLRRTDEQRRKLVSLLVDAQEAERRRLAGDIHDDTIQKMAAVGMRLEVMKARLPEELRESVDSVSRTVSLAVKRLRYLMFELHPPALDRAGLEAALREHLGETAEASQLSFSLDSRLVDEPSQETRTIAYRIVQEALANVRKHAQANHVEVLLEPRDGGLFVAVRDDGVGFSPSEVGEPQPGHLGLQSMRERAELAGGWLRVASDSGRGTTVEFWLPAADPARGAG